MKTFILTLILLFCITNSTIFAEEASLAFNISSENPVNINISRLKKQLKVHEIELFDLNYEKKKSYKAFDLQNVLNLAYGEKWKLSSYTDISFKALDGYEAVSKTSFLQNEGGYLAFEDIEFSNWEPVGRNEANPGPFYIVWLKKDQTPEYGYPWPWQLKEINLIAFKDQYPEVYPDGISENSPVFAGFTIFKERCLRCHSINRQGGKVGPDLNAPKNILEYRSQKMVREFIKNPSEYRYTHMPDHKDLSKKDLDNTIRYFIYLGNESDK